MSEKKPNGNFHLFPDMDPNSAILNEKEIADLVAQANLISHETFDERCLESTSYDIRAGGKAIVGGEGAILDTTKDPLVIMPGSYAGVISCEKIKLPKQVLGQIGAKRKLSYEGLILLTGALVDPGYEGHLLFGLYNASTKKVVVPAQSKICSLTFVWLDKEQKPVDADPDLLAGDFPSDFVRNMANMDVIPWAEISQEVRRIQQLAKDVLDLRQKYDNVVEPIEKLTALVGTVNSDVGQLTKDIQTLTEKTGKLDDITRENARQLTAAIQGVELLTDKVKDVKISAQTNTTQISSTRARVAKFSALFYIVGSILLVILGALVNKYFITPNVPSEQARPTVVSPTE